MSCFYIDIFLIFSGWGSLSLSLYFNSHTHTRYPPPFSTSSFFKSFPISINYPHFFISLYIPTFVPYLYQHLLLSANFIIFQTKPAPMCTPKQPLCCPLKIFHLEFYERVLITFCNSLIILKLGIPSEKNYVLTLHALAQVQQTFK